jgi:hypothetical protein
MELLTITLHAVDYSFLAFKLVFKNTNNNKKPTNRNIVILFKNIINVLIFLSYLIMSDEEIK